MCDFKQGDEIVCVDDSGLYGSDVPRVDCVYVAGQIRTGTSGRLFVRVVGFPDAGFGYYANRFRKAKSSNNRLTIEAFSVIKDGGFEEPKRAPAKTPEPVS